MANMTSYSPASENAKPQESPVGSNPSNNAPAKPKSKPRKRVNTAEKRNQHNAIERARRETLNGKFISLARLLPSLAAVRRPSKSAIVNGSIAHLTHQRNQRLLAARLLRSLSAEREALIKECNEWRFANGLPARDDSTAWTDEVEEVCNVEKEQFGTFASMFDGDGDNDGEGGMDDMEEEGTAQPGEMTIEQAAAIAAQASFGPGGLLTPRSSTDMSSLLSSSWAQSMTHNNNNASFVPQTASSLPFNAFMNDSSTDSPASNSGSGFMPTPSTSAHAFLGGLPPVHQTPSPASSQSFDEAPKSSFTEQQLLFLRAIQQQQHMQQRQNLSMQQLQQLIQGYPLGMGFGNGNGNGNNGAALNNANGNSFASLLGGMNDSTGSDSPFAFFNSVNMQQGQTQFNQAMFAHSLGNGSGSSANVNVPAPPTLSRAQTENLEAWRKMSAMPNNLRNTLPMSMTFDQLQQARNSMDGF